MRVDLRSCCRRIILEGYLPIDVFEPSGTTSKGVSRNLEVGGFYRCLFRSLMSLLDKYSFGDFATYQIAKIVGNSSADIVSF